MPHQIGTSGAYWVRLSYSNDSVVYWRRFLMVGHNEPLFISNSSGQINIPVSSLPIGDLWSIVEELGNSFGSYVAQGDTLYVRCRAQGYQDSYAAIGVYPKVADPLTIVMKR